MATANYLIVGTIRFGVAAMDRGAMLADISDIRYLLDMEDAAGEILGFSDDLIFHQESSEQIIRSFNKTYEEQSGDFLPQMLGLGEQAGLGQVLEMYGYFSAVMIAMFVFVMFIVLWNAGLMASLRRYGEIGVRLAIGENKGHLYRTMIWESLIIGCLGSAAGTILGLLISWYLQTVGFDISSMMKNASMVISDVLKARITPTSYYIGFIPGLLATLLGTSLSGIGIYKRQTSQLAKELET
jgi:putative ABC transport system permease protein